MAHASSKVQREKVARVLVPVLGAATLLPQVSTGIGLIAGCIVALTLGNPWASVTRKLTTPLLQGAVIGLGFGMDIRVVLETGRTGVWSTAVGILLCMLAGAILGRLLGVARDVGVLITVGTAICGGSAIAAVVPALRAKDHDATVALAVVFVLNAVGLVVFPWLGHALQLGEQQFGVWAALAIHDTSSVVGASATYGTLALKTATTLKLTRALWIVPLAFAVGIWAARSTRSHDQGLGRPAAKMPWFIVGFLLAAAAATYVPGLHDAGVVIARIARQLLVLTLFLIGSHLSRASLQAVGARPLVFGIVLWVVVGAASLAAVVLGLVS